MFHFKNKSTSSTHPISWKIYKYYLSKKSWYTFQSLKIKVGPSVFHPSLFFSTNILLRYTHQLDIKNKKILASDLAKKLHKFGIMTRPFFWPMHEQDVFKKMNLFKKTKFPNSSYIARYGLYLPSYYKLKNDEIDYISKIVNKVLI